jgi:hypothetical protein
MSAVGNFQNCGLRLLTAAWLAVLSLGLPGAANADDTNGLLPTVSVQVERNATESGALTGIFTVLRTGDTAQPLGVNYRVSGTATNGVDYQRLSGAVTIPAGQSAAQVEVTPVNHQQEGDSRNVTLTLAPRNQPFTIIALPDTQYYTREIYGGVRDIFTLQTQWIVDHKDDSNIVFVLHEGDLTDQNTAMEWTNARTSMSLLDGVVPYAVAVGNHDGLGGRQSQTALFNQFFPLSRFQSLPTFGGVFESNRMDNCYHLFSTGGVDWLVLSLEFGPRDNVLAWANQVATDYPDRRVIVLTHAHVYPDNTLYGSSANQAALPTDYGRMNNGTDVWEKFLRHHANVCAVFSGHLGFGRLVDVGDYGNQVFQMTADYQFEPLGGGGYLRIVQFYPDQDKMTVKTYSPYLNNWRADSANQFVYTNLGVFAAASPGYLVSTQSAGASLIITNDNVDSAPPAVTNLTCMGMPSVIKVTFNEPVEAASAQDVTNYSLDHDISVTGATLSADGRTVALALDSDPVANGVYTLTVNHVKDRAGAGNEMTLPAAVTFTYLPVLLADDFTNGILDGWTVVDNGNISAPSRWLELPGGLVQLSGIYGPTGNAYNHRQGTYLCWNDPPALGWSDYTFSVTFNNADSDGVGLLFRYQNPSNYFKVDLDSRKTFRKLFKMANGVETTLATEFAGYVPGSNYVLRVETTNSDITILLNGTVLFGGTITDNNNLKAGTVALYCWGSQGVLFNKLSVTPLRRFPRVTISSPTNGSVFTQPISIPITVDASDPDGHIIQVGLFQGSSLLVTLTNAPYLYQWTNPSPASYTLTAQILDDAGLIGVSPPINLVVQPPPPKPVIIVQPAGQNVQRGSGVILRVQADGPPSMHYQWQFNGMPINGATNTYVILNNVQTNDAGSYMVIVTNPWGSTDSQSAVLSVNPVAQPGGDTNGPAAVFFSNLEFWDPGIPLVSINATNLAVVRIDWSSNCLSWVPLLTLTNCGYPLYFADPDAFRQPRRFYRAVPVP